MLSIFWFLNQNNLPSISIKKLSMSTQLKFKGKKTKVDMNQKNKKLCLKNVNEKLVVKIILKSNIPKW